MLSRYRIERDRGTAESRQQFAMLREKWPLAFPAKPEDVRPLAIGAAGEIASAMGWSPPYTLGVLGSWKMSPVYCQAVLCYDQRIALDGEPAELIDPNAKELATMRLAQLAARKAARKDRKMAGSVATKSAASAATKMPANTTEQLRSRVRAPLLRQ